MPKLTSSNHPLCKLCTHRAHGPVPTYYDPAWCFMFRQGEHVLTGGQGWCAQFKQDKEEIKRLTERITNGRKRS